MLIYFVLGFTLQCSVVYSNYYYSKPTVSSRGFNNDNFDHEVQAYAISCEVILKNVRGTVAPMVTRIVIVNEDMQVFFDSLVRPMKLAMESFSNTTEENDEKLESFYHIRTKVVNILRFQILVGYKLNYYLRLLRMHHPVYLRRDTAHFSKFRNLNDSMRLSLAELSLKYLGEDMLDPDNVTANALLGMKLYLKYGEEWDKEMQQRPLQPMMDSFAIALDTIKGQREDGIVLDMAARATIVDTNGAIIYQKIFRPVWPVVNYRSTLTDLYPVNFTNAVPIENERDKIESLLRNSILVGHDLGRDLQLLGIKHPFLARKDTHTFGLFHRGLAPAQCKTLNDIANHFLDKTILQSIRGHLNPAHTAMLLYLQYKREWDLEGKKFSDQMKEKRNLPPKKLITPIAVYYDRILVASQWGQLKVIGRMVIVNGNYQCVYDRFVKPNNMTILDCFPDNTGIHPEDIEHGSSIEEIKDDLVNILRDKILIGYNLKHFLLLIGMKFQMFYRRDLRLFNKFATPDSPKPTISQVAYRFLNVSLTSYTHPVEKARIFMNLYYRYKEDWDIFVAQAYRDLKMISLNRIEDVRNNSGEVVPIAMHCSSVTTKNTGLLGYQMLARVTLVDRACNCVYNKFVKPYSDIVDYRTNETGIHPEQLINGEEYYKVVQDVVQLLSGKVIVGEQLSKCFKLLRHKADWWLLRDISLFSTFRRLNNQYIPLKEICSKYLGYTMVDVLDPVERAKALMNAYLKFKHLWEVEIVRKREVLQNKSKMFQQYRNENSTARPYTRSHILH